jgi:sodium/potassium/calcium exchanger 6
MNRLPSLLRPARSGPRYSVRPFYASLLVITVLAVASWTLVGYGNGQTHERTAAGVLVRRADEPEVFPLPSRGMVSVANHVLV